MREFDQFHRNITVRIPLVPGFNDDLDNINQTAKFVINLKKIYKIEILPYVNFGESKYEMLDLAYEIPYVKSLSPNQLKQVKAIINRHGVDCDIVE